MTPRVPLLLTLPLLLVYGRAGNYETSKGERA